GHLAGEPRYRGPVAGAAGDDDGPAGDLAAARRDQVTVPGLPHRGDILAGPDRRAGDRGEALDEIGHLAGGHVPVRVLAFVAKARQAALPVRREQPQRVPALAAPG